MLEGCNKVGQVSGIVGRFAMAALSAVALINNNSDGNNDTTA